MRNSSGVIDKLEFNNKFAQLGPEFYSHVKPAGFAKPFLVNFNSAAAALIGLAAISPVDLADYFCGNKLISNGEYIACLYSGHQFGSYVPQLGDGRAIMIGETNGWEIQLKGSGKTPYSRFGDGRAVLRSCIREYLCSEAMHSLNIPTTRALVIIGSDEDVQRETVEKAAIMTRLAPTHIRFGHFEYFYYAGKHRQLRELADFVTANFYPGTNYESFFEQVVEKTARLIAKWQTAGFAHGVMNTDNMSILGLSIDYGPFGFMEAYKPGFICNHSDYSGRYAFNRQPSIGLWNLYALGMSLTPLIPNEVVSKILDKYYPYFVAEYARQMRNKLGLLDEAPEDKQLAGDLLDMMAASGVDYNNFFRRLAQGENLRDDFVDRGAYDQWQVKYLRRRGQGVAGQQLILQNNPKYILRNYLAETAIREAQSGNYAEISNLLKLLQKPYEEQPGNENYASKPPLWAAGLEVSCSS